MKLLFSTGAWPLSYQLSGDCGPLMLGFLFSSQLFSVFKVHAHPMVFSMGLHLM